MSNQSSVEWLYQEFERIDKEFHVDSHEYNYAKNLAFKISKAMHKEESVDFALYAMMAESFNDLPEATKNQLREAIEVKYKEYYKL